MSIRIKKGCDKTSAGVTEKVLIPSSKEQDMSITIDRFYGSWHITISSSNLIQDKHLLIEPFVASGVTSPTQAMVTTESEKLKSGVYEFENCALVHVYEENGDTFRMSISLYEEFDETGKSWLSLYGVYVETDPREVVVWGAEEDDPS